MFRPNPGQKFQQQMQQRQQQQQHQQMGAAWQMQQEEEKRRREEEKRRQDEAKKSGGGKMEKSGSNPPPVTFTSNDDRFSKVERGAARLNQKRAAGQLGEADWQRQMNELMVQDDAGTWWMVGVETGQWFRFEGSAWVRANPPGHSTQGQLFLGGDTTTGDDDISDLIQAHAGGHRFLAVITFIILLALFEIIFFKIVDSLQSAHIGMPEFIIMSAIGLVLNFFITRRIWRGY